MKSFSTNNNDKPNEKEETMEGANNEKLKKRSRGKNLSTKDKEGSTTVDETGDSKK